MPIEIVNAGFQTKDLLETTIRAWIDNFPKEARLFHKAVREYVKVLKRPSGMDKHPSGDSAVLGFIPMRIWVAINNVLPGFWNEPGARELFFGIYTKASIKA